MRYLPCLLLWVFPQVWGQSEPQQNYSFRCLQISSFTNSTCSSTDCLAWLGDLQTHRWSNASNTIRFVRPWSQGKLSNQEWEKLQRLFQIYRFSFTTDIKEMVKMVPGLHYPIEVQLSAGCEVYPENVLESYLHVAFQGEYVLSFQETYWKKAPEAPSWLEKPIEELNKDQGTRESVQGLLNDTCPQFVRGLLEKGKPDLEKQEKPVAWLSSGLSPAHGHLQLVCHVSGFYPKPIWVMWMRGDKEQQSTQRSDIVPNADGTWYLQATLDVEAGDAAGLACWVKHSSLGGQDIIRYWAGGRQLPVGLVILIVMLVFLMAGVLICSAIVIWNRWHYQDVL